VRQDVEFLSSGEIVRAHYYAPDSAEAKLPVIVMAGGWCYVKELVQPHYAKCFTDAGFAALVFDYRGLGTSDGQPREHLDPWQQVEDYKNAITYVCSRPDVDSERVGIWGISYSGGHVLIVGATDARVKCIVANIPVVDGWQTMQLVHGALGFRKLVAAIEADRVTRSTTGEFGYIPMSTTEPSTTLSTWPFPEVTESFIKLKESEAPNHNHRNTIASVELLMQYSVFPFLPRLLDTPTLMTVAEGDDITIWADEIRAYNAIATPQKRLFIFKKTSHMTLYSNRSRLEIAAEQARDWFSMHLSTLATS
jgi:uncharacterized protein